MKTTFSRRSFVQGGSAVAAGALFGMQRAAYARPAAKVKEIKVISQLEDVYHGWPTLTRRSNGQLLVVCSGGREQHVCPFGRVDLMRSDDGGNNWTFPRTLLDGPIDDRDAGILETTKGSLLVTTFTSLAYERSIPKDGERRAKWLAAHNRISAEARKAELGQWMIRSVDGGVTWSARYPSIVNSPHGPIQLKDGRVLYAGKKLYGGNNEIGVCESTDDGKSWKWLAPIPTRKGDNHKDYHELHAVEAANGTLIVHIRNHNSPNAQETLQSESQDGGKTWSVPHSIGVWGLPSFLTRLHDDRLLMSYGHRRKPYGNQARVSKDHGKSWSDAIINSGDGAGGDLGYPSTVQLDDGSLVTVWYEKVRGSNRAVLRQAKWTLDG